MTDDLYLAGDGPTGVLVLAGSSGRVEVDRCRVLAEAGATAASYRWFGEAVDRVPLESFDVPLALLHERCDRLIARDVRRCGGRPGSRPCSSRHPEAGHRLLLPGETPPAPSRSAHGGSPEADTGLGRLVWPPLLRLLSP